MPHPIEILNTGLNKDTLHWFMSFSKELVISAVGGFVGGALAYGWYIERKETRKNIAAKKAGCTKALLATQMVLSFQIQELRELQTVCQRILDFEFANSTLSELLKNPDTLIIGKLIDKIGRGGQSHELFRATKFIIVKPSMNHLINMPHDIFDIKEFKLKSQTVTHDELNAYFQMLSDCNRAYVKIISLLDRHNETRDMVFNQLISTPENESRMTGDNMEKLKFLSVIVAMAKISLDAMEKINQALEKMEKAFSQTECYINEIGKSSAICMEINPK